MSLPEMLGRYIRQVPLAEPACLPGYTYIRQQQQAGVQHDGLKSGSYEIRHRYRGKTPPRASQTAKESLWERVQSGDKARSRQTSQT